MEVCDQIMIIFVPYQLSGIQKGIQAGHTALEYSNTYNHSIRYKQFIEKNKTWIVLNGGTTNNSMDSPGDMQNLLNNIKEWNDLNKSCEKGLIDFEVFYEPDLNGALSGVCFLVPLWLWENRGNDYINFSELYSESVGKYNFIKDLIRDASFA